MEFMTASALRAHQPGTAVPGAATTAATVGMSGSGIAAMSLMPPPPPLSAATAATDQHISATAIPFGMFTPPALGHPSANALKPTTALPLTSPGTSAKTSPSTGSARSGGSASSSPAVTPPALTINHISNGAGGSSFAAALRNLAKNATVNVNNNLSLKEGSTTARCIPISATAARKAAAAAAAAGTVVTTGGGASLASTTTTVAALPQIPTILPPPPPPSLMDVRKGFGKSSATDSLTAPSPAAVAVTSTSTTLTAASHVASGFQPYRPSPTPGQGQIKSPTEGAAAAAAAASPFMSAATGMHPGYAAAAAAAGYHPSLFSGVSPYTLEMENMYRSQLDRYFAAAAAAANPSLQQPPPPVSQPSLVPFSLAAVTTTTTSFVSTKPSVSSTPALSSLLSSPLAPAVTSTTTSSTSCTPSTNSSKASKRKSNAGEESSKEKKRKAEENRMKAQARANKDNQTPPTSSQASSALSSSVPSPYSAASLPYFNLYGMYAPFAAASSYLQSPIFPSQSTVSNSPKSSWEQALESLTVSQQQSIHAAAAAAAVATAGGSLNPLLYSARPLLPPPAMVTPQALPIPASIASASVVTTTAACATPPVSSGEAIKLPTEPLERSQVSSSSSSPAKKTPSTKSHLTTQKHGLNNNNNKRLFVRPFEDDFRTPKKDKTDSKMSATTIKKKSGKVEEETATLHYGDDVRVKLPISSLQGRQQQDHQNGEERASMNAQTSDIVPSETASSVGDFSEDGLSNPPKDSLRYLRYFRLITHRKKSGEGSSDRTSANIQPPTAIVEKSDDHADSHSSNDNDDDSGDESAPLSDLRRQNRRIKRSRRMQLPLPTSTSSRVEPDSGAKVMFMSSLGLWRESDADKIEHEAAWNIILDERLSRDGSNSTPSASRITAYFSELRNRSTGPTDRRKHDCDSAFLDPQLLGTETLSIASYNHNRATVTSTSSSPLIQPAIIKPLSPPSLPPKTSSSTTHLPILLSTLLPLPPTTAASSSPSSQPPNLQSVLLNNVHPFVASGGASEDSKNKRIPIVPWPGVEAIVESYKNYAKDCREEKLVLETRMRELQQDIFERRAAVDTLASRLANLSRLRRYQEGRRAEQEASFKTAARFIVECTKSVANTIKGGEVINTTGVSGATSDAGLQR